MIKTIQPVTKDVVTTITKEEVLKCNNERSSNY